MPIRAVWFDVGETLIDESREYGTWADWLGVPRHTFSAMFGAVIARGGDYREVFQHFRPGFDLEAERQARLDAGIGEYLNGYDLYPDVRPSLQALKDAGYFVGVAGNQTARAGRFLRELNLPCDVLATSDEWGATKPDAGFFDKLVAVRRRNEYWTFSHWGSTSQSISEVRTLAQEFRRVPRGTDGRLLQDHASRSGYRAPGSRYP